MGDGSVRDSDLEPHLGAGGVPLDPPVVRQRVEEEQTAPVTPPADLRRVEARALIADGDTHEGAGVGDREPDPTVSSRSCGVPA